MSFTLAGGLSPQPDIIEMADFWEIECLKKADYSASLLDISKSLGIIEDVQEDEIEEAEYELEEKQQQLVDEIVRRINSTDKKYPFSLSDKGYVLSVNEEISSDWLWIYTYLLLATRNNMRDNKVVADIDGTRIFEKISKDILLNYLGQNSKGLVFGTAHVGGFRAKLDALIISLNDGVLHADNTITYNPQDDKLDIVAWIPFRDNLCSKFICFAQCKTGTHWEGTIHQLDVSNFLKKWFMLHPRLDPIRTFMIADVLDPNNFYHKAGNNLFMDRIRLTSLFVLTADNDWYDNLRDWTRGVMDQFKLSFKAA